MALPNAVQYEEGRIVTITAYKRGTLNFQDLSGATMTGIIETTPGPDFVTRAIAGDLDVVNSGADGQFTFTWTYDPTDTADAGQFTVQFIATIGATVIYRSFPEPWTVVRSPEDPV